MNWYICEKTEDEYLNHTAGVKAREDLDYIWEDMGMQAIRMVVGADNQAQGNAVQKLARHVRKKRYWKNQLACVKPQDAIYIQFPVRNHTIFLASVLRRLVKKGTKVVLFVHDLEAMRHIKETNISYKKKKRMELEEISAIKAASYVVVHNQKMKQLMHEAFGLPEASMIDLEIFDYLVGEGKKKDEVSAAGYSCIIAGNLDREKAAYAYALPEGVPFELYGPNYTGTPTAQIRYHGSYPPAELPYVLEGSFGLVWDGTSGDTCAGVYGEYLKVNNPHKTSLYLASGIPVVIWKEAALAEFVEHEGVGITVSSLPELKTVFAELTEERYNGMREAAQKLSARLTSGYYTRKAVRKCEQ